MFKLYIYNPEHDIVLGKNESNYTISKGALLTRKNFGHIPAFWANDGDWIVVDDINNAYVKLQQERRNYATVKFVTEKDLSCLSESNLPQAIIPWGWDSNIVKSLLRINPLFIKLVPDEITLNIIRCFSSRVFAATSLVDELVNHNNGLVGQMKVFTGTEEELNHIIENENCIVLKSPWSCSGRGVNIVKGYLTESVKGWFKNTMREQKAIIIEPYYDKVLDFAMEFMSSYNEGIQYLGLSIFKTTNRHYTNNLIDTELNKRSFIEKYVSIKLLDIVREKIKQITCFYFNGKYNGPFGVDMMIVNTQNGYILHPCVELNLRLTMGHASLLDFKY